MLGCGRLVVKSWKKRGNMYLGLITSYAWLWKVKIRTLINDRDGDIKLEVMSTDVEGRQECKRHNEQLTWDLKKNKKNMKIREQIKDWKNIHAKRVTVEKKFFKERKKEPENVVGKRKKTRKKKITKDNTNTFYSYFSDIWALGRRMFFCCIIWLKMYSWKFCCSVRHEEERYNSLRK